MKILKCVFMCLVFGSFLAACQVGIEPLPGSQEFVGGPAGTDLRAEVWFLGGSYKSVLDWDEIAGADSYNLFWAGNITYADLNAVYSYLASITEPISVAELEEQLNNLGIAVSYGEADVAVLDYEHLDLSEERSYCYLVTGKSDGEPVGSSDVECISTLKIPAVTTASTSGAVTISWLPVDGAVKYYVYRTVAVSSPSINVSKQVLLDDSLCEGVEPDVFVGDTTELFIDDDDNGQKLNNCLDYCYTVVPEDIDGNLMNGDTQWKLARPVTLGVIDPSFGDNGLASMNNEGEFKKVALTADESIITNLYIDQQYNGLVKFSADGSQLIWQTANLIDHFDVVEDFVLGSTGSGGEYAILTGYKDIDPDIMVYDGRMITCKVIGIEGNSPSLDTSFGPSQNGCYQDAQSWSNGRGVALDSSGRILVAGRHGTDPDFRFTVWRLTASGLLDSSFANGGMYWSGSSTVNTEAYAVTTVQAGGSERIAAVGYSVSLLIHVPQPSLMKIELLSGSGASLDVVTDMPLGGSTYGNAVATSSDGTILVGGSGSSSIVGGSNQVAVWDFIVTQGGSTLSSPSAHAYDYDDHDSAVEVMEDCRGKPLAAGGTGHAEYSAGFVIRADEGFVLDVFGNQDPVDGWFVHPDLGVVGSPIGDIRGLAEEIKGRLILSGVYSPNGFDFEPALWRLE